MGAAADRAKEPNALIQSVFASNGGFFALRCGWVVGIDTSVCSLALCNMAPLPAFCDGSRTLMDEDCL
jgi:hypothetical protein